MKQLQLRLNEIDQILKSMPKCKAGDIEQAYKHQLYCEKRRIHFKLCKERTTWSKKIEFVHSRGSICNICGDNKNPSIDHIIPISKGGTDTIDNFQVLCIKCNARKGNRYGK